MIQLPIHLKEQLTDETMSHSYRVAFLANDFAEYLNFPEDLKQLLFEGGLLHDLGKQYIPKNVLYKPSPLNPEEFQQVRQHVALAVKDPGFTHLAPEVQFMILQHHEKIDGTGYPLGLKGDEIHPFAQIIALCDVFDALTSPRCYHEPRSKEATLTFIQERSGTQFHPELVDDFIAFARQLKPSQFQAII